MSFCRRIKLENILNLRDLGGYPSEYGVTKFGRFLRGGVVAVPEEWEIRALEDYGVRTVIDLRGDFEAENMPLRLDRIKNSEFYSLSLYEANVANANIGEKSLVEIYASIADGYRENIRKALETVACAKDGAVFYHCFFGKDRTGILSMLLLSIAGVDEADIIADYQVTYAYVHDYIKKNADVLWCQDGSMHYSLPETMEGLIDYIKKKYGSVADYIKSTGISDESVEKIRRRFFD